MSGADDCALEGVPITEKRPKLASALVGEETKLLCPITTAIVVIGLARELQDTALQNRRQEQQAAMTCSDAFGCTSYDSRAVAKTADGQQSWLT